MFAERRHTRQRLGGQHDVDAEGATFAQQIFENFGRLLGDLVVTGEQLLELVDDDDVAWQRMSGEFSVVADLGRLLTLGTGNPLEELATPLIFELRPHQNR